MLALGLLRLDAGGDLGTGGSRAAALLLPGGQLGAGGQQLGPGLLQLLGVDAVVDPRQQLAAADLLEVLHRHLDHVAFHLRCDQGDLALHLGVLGAFDGAVERRDLPGVEHQSDPRQRERGDAQCGQEPAPGRGGLRRGGGGGGGGGGVHGRAGEAGAGDAPGAVGCGAALRRRRYRSASSQARVASDSQPTSRNRSL